MDKINGNNGDSNARVAAIVRSLKDMPGALLPILHRVQEELGCIPPDAVPVIASELNLTRAEVHGVVSFYHDFRVKPPGRNIVRLCRAESCQALGANSLAAHACRRLGIDFGGTTRDGSVTLLPVYCLGNCACSPAMMVNGTLYGHLNEPRMNEILSALEGWKS